MKKQWPFWMLSIQAIVMFTFAKCVCSASEGSVINNSLRERLSLYEGWRFANDDPVGLGGQLSYTNIKDWIIPSGFNLAKSTNLTVTNIQAKNPGPDILYVQSNFNNTRWRLLNLPHDWAIEEPFNQEYPATSFEPFQSKKRKAFNGLALAIIRSTAGVAGDIILKAESPGLDSSEVRIESDQTTQLLD